MGAAKAPLPPNPRVYQYRYEDKGAQFIPKPPKKKDPEPQIIEWGRGGSLRPDDEDNSSVIIFLTIVGLASLGIYALHGLLF